VNRFGRERGQMFKQVETRLLTDDGATRDGMLSALARLRERARPQDTTIVFFAGRATLGHGGECRLLAVDNDFAQRDPALGDRTPVNRAHVGHEPDDTGSITGGEIKTWASKTPGRVLMLLDLNSRGVADGLQRELASDDYGVTVISASASGENAKNDAAGVPADVQAIAQGAFCELLLKGLSPAGDLNHDGVVMLDELEAFLKRPASKPNIGGARPLISHPRLVRPYPLARPLWEVR
jgi:hypothetical protein